ncbi:hypothetical protein H0N96_02115, partial [Candidatus Micrarchaeota archaeon]|nr:hypothetical protein [Candidatus Micrarchaeota archaeon]
MHSPLSRLAFASSVTALALLLLSFSATPANALANPVLAGYSLNGIEKVSNAFFAFENKTPSSVFLLLKTSKNSSELLVSLEETASNGTPSNHSLCNAVFSMNSSSADWLEVQLPDCPRLKKNTFYHLVLSPAENASKAANASKTSPLDYATAYYAFNKNLNDSLFLTKPFPSAGWKRLNNSIPLFALKYSDGTFWRHGGQQQAPNEAPANQSGNKTLFALSNVDFVSPTLENGNVSGNGDNNWVYVNVSYTNTSNIHYNVLNWNGTNSTNAMNCTSGYHCWINKTSLVWGNYSFYVYLNQTDAANAQT